MYTLRVFLSNVDRGGNSTFSMPVKNDFVSQENCLILDFELFDKPIVEKFISTVMSAFKNRNIDNMFLLSNLYGNMNHGPQAKTLNQMQAEMNSILSEISLLIDAPELDSLYLDISDNTQLQKLNSLHLFFENKSHELCETELYTREDSRLRYCLESINNLVHLMDGPYNKIKVSNRFYFYLVTRINPTNLFFNLSDEDYMDFKMPEMWGGLQLDYATVGKDLWTGVETNDIELIKNNGLRQQEYVLPNFNITFSEIDAYHPEVRMKFATEKIENFALNHKIKQYGIDWKSPKYRPGRIQLGKFIDNIPKEVLKEKLKTFNTPVGIRIIKS